MAKTIGGNQTTGSRAKGRTGKVTEAKLTASARSSAVDAAPAAGKKSSSTVAAQATSVRAAKAVALSAAKRPGVRSAREAAAVEDEAVARVTPVSTVQPAVVQQPAVETTAGTANSMTKKLNEVSVDDDATQAEETAAAAPGIGLLLD
jgi:RNA polymerase primary sigma factor